MLRARRKNVVNCLMSETFIIDSTDVHFLKKTRGSVAPKMDMCPTKIKKKNCDTYR